MVEAFRARTIKVEKSEGTISISGIPGDTEPVGKMDLVKKGDRISVSIFNPGIGRYSDYGLSLSGQNPKIAAALAKFIEEIAEIIKEQEENKADSPK